MFTPPAPVLSLGSDLQSPSLSSQPRPPRRVSRQNSLAGECWSAPLLCVGVSPLCPPHPCGCALLCGFEAAPLRHPQSPPAKGLPSVWKPSLLTAPSHRCRSRPYSLVSFFFFLLPYPGTWGVSCLLGGVRSSASVQWMFCGSCSTCRCISYGFVGGKVISASYSSAILKVS